MEEQTPFFSIVTPVTRPELLKDALETIINQDFNDYEVLIHNNTGDEIQLPDKYASDARFKLFNHREKVNIWKNWERAFIGCKGQYVTMIPDDDGIISGGLKAVQSVLKEYPVDYVRWGLTAYMEQPNESFKSVSFPKHTGNITEIDTSELLKHLMQSLRVTRFKKFIPHIAMGCVSREMLEKIQAKSALCYVSGVPMESVTPDWCIAAKVLYEKPTAYYLDVPIYLFRGHDDSTATKDMSKNKMDSLGDPWLPHLGIKNTVLNRVFVSETLLAVQKQITGRVMFNRQSFLDEFLEGAGSPKDILRAIEYAISYGVPLNFTNHANGRYHINTIKQHQSTESPQTITMFERLIELMRKLIKRIAVQGGDKYTKTTESLSQVSVRVKINAKTGGKTTHKYDKRLFETLIS
jgi:glycosyltransferase involved in cell wall biosynthesis